MKIKILILLLILTSCVKANEIKSFKAKLVDVIDGDTIKVKYDNEVIKIRFACVDTFESKKNKHLQKQVKDSGLSEKAIINKGLKQKEELNKYLDKQVVIYYNINNKYDLYNRLLGVVKYDNTILNNGLKYYNKTYLCKHFNLD